MKKFSFVSLLLLLLGFGTASICAQEARTPQLPPPTDSLTVKQDSPEAVAIYKILSERAEPIPMYYTAADTSFYSALLPPLIFDIDQIIQTEEFHLRIDEIKRKSQDFKPIYPDSLSEYPKNLSNLYASPFLSTELAKTLGSIKLSRAMRSAIIMQRPDLITTTQSMLPDPITYSSITANEYDNRFEIKTPKHLELGEDDINTKQIRPIYWLKGFESTIQYSQNHISANWHKGGTSNLHLFMRNYFSLTYKRGDVKWVNELESKIGIYNARTDSINKYKIAEDLLRLHSNLGLRASKRWFYTIDGEMRTQLFNNQKDNSREIITAFASPVTFDAGIGMKYELEKTFASDSFKKLNFSANIAPFSMTYIYTLRDDIDKGRIGFDPDMKYRLSFGSTIRAYLNFDISQTLKWQSRFFYNTSYSRIETEWENTFHLAITRFFSTSLNLNLRYDDSVKNTDGSLKDLLQYTELFSFGFNYKF